MGVSHLNDLQAKYGNRGLEVVSIAFERSSNSAKRVRKSRKVIEKHGIEYTVLNGGRIGLLFDDLGDVYTALPDLPRVEGFPIFAVIGRDGTLKAIETTFDPEITPKKIEALVEEALGENG